MNKNIPTETERKFLIEYPNVSFLEKIDGCKVTDIIQTYLLCGSGSMRVRKSVCKGNVKYIRNIKNRISDMSHLENEKEISEETYCELLFCRDAARSDIAKTRYAFPYSGHIIEVDVYPFWNDRAVLEVELQSENEQFEIPEYLKIIKEVTFDSRYSNKALSKEIITEKL